MSVGRPEKVGDDDPAESVPSPSQLRQNPAHYRADELGDMQSAASHLCNHDICLLGPDIGQTRCQITRPLSPQSYTVSWRKQSDPEGVLRVGVI